MAGSRLRTSISGQQVFVARCLIYFAADQIAILEISVQFLVLGDQDLYVCDHSECNNVFVI